jgi:hypothetical protein
VTQCVTHVIFFCHHMSDAFICEIYTNIKGCMFMVNMAENLKYIGE